MGFSGYFIILWDLLNYLRENNEMNGVGRGSGASGLINYCLQITDIDPILYKLPFERFLNPERVSMPDLDIDVTNRVLAIQYLIDNYGENKVCQVLQFECVSF